MIIKLRYTFYNPVTIIFKFFLNRMPIIISKMSNRIPRFIQNNLGINLYKNIKQFKIRIQNLRIMIIIITKMTLEII